MGLFGLGKLQDIGWVDGWGNLCKAGGKWLRWSSLSWSR